MKGLFIPGITAEMFRNGCLESIEALMSEGKIFDIEYDLVWIPVSEMLPNNYEEIFVTTKYGMVEKAEYVKKLNGDTFWLIRGCDFSSQIVAWMPLPEPYKEENE